MCECVCTHVCMGDYDYAGKCMCACAHMCGFHPLYLFSDLSTETILKKTFLPQLSSCWITGVTTAALCFNTALQLNSSQCSLGVRLIDCDFIRIVTELFCVFLNPAYEVQQDPFSLRYQLLVSSCPPRLTAVTVLEITEHIERSNSDAV